MIPVPTDGADLLTMRDPTERVVEQLPPARIQLLHGLVEPRHCLGRTCHVNHSSLVVVRAARVHAVAVRLSAILERVSTSSLFYVINALPLPIWAAWILAPRSRLARHFAVAVWPWMVLGLVYVALLFTSMFVVHGPPGGHMGSLRGVMRIFDSEWGVLAGWAHYLCFDAFVARWIVNDAGPSYRLSPVIALTCFFGPAGLLLYLVLRSRRAPAGRSAPRSS